MKKAEIKFFKELKDLRMNIAEREHVREALFLHMEKHKADEDALVRRMLHGGATFHAVPKYRIWKMQFAPLIAGAILLTGLGGVSYAAESSVPGEVLYSVKVNVNETIRTAMTISSEQRVVWETERVTRRIKEAETLAARGDLTKENSELLSARVAEHSAALAIRLRESEEAEDEGTAGDIKANASLALEGHDDLLMGIIVASAIQNAESGDNAAEDVALIVQAIRATAASLERPTDAVEENTDVTLSNENDGTDEATITTEESMSAIAMAKNQYARAEERVAESRTYLTEQRDKIGELTALQASRIVRSAEENLHLGERRLEWREFSAATQNFREAQRLAQRATLLVESNIRLAIEVIIEPVTEPDEILVGDNEIVITEEPLLEDVAVTEEPVDEVTGSSLDGVEAPPTINEVLVDDTLSETVLDQSALDAEVSADQAPAQ